MAKRIDQLDGIRALAIGAVFIHHAFKVKLLWMGVDLFFILSGFLITGILIKNKDKSLKGYFGHFYQRRALRILPPYILLMIVTTYLYGTGWASHWYYYLFLMNFVTAFTIPHPGSITILWSLAVEEQFYLVWPFIVYFLSEEAIAWVAGGLIFAAPVLRWIFTPSFIYEWPIYELTPFRMDLLAVGALLAVVWRKRPDLIRRFGQFGPLFSALAVVTLAVLSKKPNFNTTANTRLTNVSIYELTLIISAGIILWALSGKGISILTLAPMRYLGRISYSIYLIHLTFILMLTYYLHKGDIIDGLVSAAGAIVYATASWFLMERPLLERKPKPTPEAAAKA